MLALTIISVSILKPSRKNMSPKLYIENHMKFEFFYIQNQNFDVKYLNDCTNLPNIQKYIKSLALKINNSIGLVLFRVNAHSPFFWTKIHLYLSFYSELTKKIQTPNFYLKRIP